MVGDALLKGGIPAAAALFGRYEDTVAFGNITKRDFVDLAGTSHAIVTGDVINGRPVLTEDRQLIVTEYEVIVTRTIKGEGGRDPIWWTD